MAAIHRAPGGSVTSPPKRARASTFAGEKNGAPRAYIARLAELHDEAAETALLANLLGRVPYLAAILLAVTIATAMLVHAPAAPLLTWVTLIGAGLVALMRVYVIMIAAPFERAPLRFFARDLQAIMLYVGFAWGAGSFLALPADVTLVHVLAFGVGPTAFVALITRASDAVACFAIPAVLLSAAAAASRPFESGAFASAAILATGFAIMAVTYLRERALVHARGPRLAATPG